MSMVTTINSRNRVQIYSILLSNVQKTIKYSKNCLIFAKNKNAGSVPSDPLSTTTNTG